MVSSHYGFRHWSGNIFSKVSAMFTFFFTNKIEICKLFWECTYFLTWRTLWKCINCTQILMFEIRRHCNHRRYVLHHLLSQNQVLLSWSSVSYCFWILLQSFESCIGWLILSDLTRNSHLWFNVPKLHLVQNISSVSEHPLEKAYHLPIICKKTSSYFFTISVFRTSSLYFTSVFKNTGNFKSSILRYWLYLSHTLDIILCDIMNEQNWDKWHYL